MLRPFISSVGKLPIPSVAIAFFSLHTQHHIVPAERHLSNGWQRGGNGLHFLPPLRDETTQGHGRYFGSCPLRGHRHELPTLYASKNGLIRPTEWQCFFIKTLPLAVLWSSTRLSNYCFVGGKFSKRRLKATLSSKKEGDRIFH